MSCVQGSSLMNFPGFSKFPADYFNRPFSRAAEDISDLCNSGHQCIHARAEADIMLDYLKQFL
jgi:hypothetical protein